MWIQSLMVGLAVVFAVSAGAADAPPADYMERFQSLPPAQQEALLKSIKKQELLVPATAVAPAEPPRLVVPLTPRQDSADVGPDKEKLLDPLVDSDAVLTEADERLKPFGYDLFANARSSFTPATDIPVDVNYMMGPGDTVQLQLFGKEHAEYSLLVSRDGTIHFPRIGAIAVAGLTFAEMQRVLARTVKEQLIGDKAIISLGKLRSIRVFILGDVQQPGSYTVSALSTMTNALFVGGGVSEIGSLRNIQLKRRGKIVAQMDLYDLLLRGDTSQDARLQPGDVIFVPPAGAMVAVSGEVRRPAIYELGKERSVGQVLELAGGMLPAAYPPASQIERISKQGERIMIDIDLGQKTGLSRDLHSGDVVRIYSVLEKMDDIVVLNGHVQRPGVYQWKPGMQITDLIPSIDKDLLTRPDLGYALVRRELPPDGRIEMQSIDLEQAYQNSSGSDNIELQSRDEVFIFGFVEARDALMEPLIESLKAEATHRLPARVVRVSGLVRHSGDYPLDPGMRISDLLRAGGGLAEAAYALGAELTRYEVVDGRSREVGHINVALANVISGDSVSDLLLSSYDELHIKRLPEWVQAATVTLHGEVRFPGIYPIARGEQLSKLLERAGGLTDMAFPQGAMFIREELRERERQRIDEMSRKLEADLASLSLQLAQEKGERPDSLAIIQDLGEQLRSIEPGGRLVINLPELLETSQGGRRSQYDITLMDGDELVIPAVTQAITVTGEVFYPTSHLYEKKLSLDNYVNMSGGSTRKADTKRIYVVRANGRVDTGGSWLDSINPDDILPGDTIVVPLNIDRIRPLTLWTNVSQIIYQLAIAAASANAIGVF